MKFISHCTPFPISSYYVWRTLIYLMEHMFDAIIYKSIPVIFTLE